MKYFVIVLGFFALSEISAYRCSGSCNGGYGQCQRKMVNGRCTTTGKAAIPISCGCGCVPLLNGLYCGCKSGSTRWYDQKQKSSCYRGGGGGGGYTPPTKSCKAHTYTKPTITTLRETSTTFESTRKY